MSIRPSKQQNARYQISEFLNTVAYLLARHHLRIGSTDAPNSEQNMPNLNRKTSKGPVGAGPVLERVLKLP
jgi:hypothetical protein